MNEMIQYVKKGNKIKTKDRHGNTVTKHTKKKGIFLATPHDEDRNVLLIGWSLCNENAGDRFNKVDAYIKAYNRGDVWYREKRNYYIPDSLRGDFFAFVKRAKRYFKQCKVPQWVCDGYEYDFNTEEVITLPRVTMKKYKYVIYHKSPADIAGLVMP